MTVLRAPFTLLAMALLLIVATQACGGAATPTSVPAAKPAEGTVPAAKPAATAIPAVSSPQYGGVLRVGHYADVVHFDNQMVASVAQVGPLAPLYSGLVNQDWETEGFPFKGDLATGWETSSDGKVWTFQIRENVLAHDGTKLTSKGVADSLIRTGNGATDLSPLVLNSVIDVTAPDVNTVVVTFSEHRPDFLALLGSENAGIFPDVVTDDLGADGKKKIELIEQVIGTGAFKLLNFEPGVKVEMERFDDYYIDGRPYLDGISHIIITDPSTRNAAFMAHEIDLIWAAANSTTMVQEAKRAVPEARFELAVGSVYWYYMINPNTPLLKDIRVRQALYLAADRWGASDALEFGQGRPLGQLPPVMGGLTFDEMDQLPAYQRDRTAAMEQARSLIDDAGAKGAKLTVFTDPRPHIRDGTLWYAGNWRDAGLDVVIDVATDDTARRARQDKCEFDMMLLQSAVIPPDPTSYLTFWEEGSIFRNPCQNPFSDMQSLFREQASEADVAKRKKLVRQLVDLSIENLWVVNLHEGGYWVSAWPEVQWTVPNHLTGNIRFKDAWLKK